MVRWFELVEYDAPAMQDAIAAVADNDVVLDPTLVFFDALVRGDDPTITEASELGLAAPFPRGELASRLPILWVMQGGGILYPDSLLRDTAGPSRADTCNDEPRGAHD